MSGVDPAVVHACLRLSILKIQGMESDHIKLRTLELTYGNPQIASTALIPALALLRRWRHPWNLK